ncbi:cytochrome P450 [Bimuria novae-zelandiae CBS 107.79]|uniref:Cytochrome P450 n=1 Tax=Bimuria novae-zelandiae CBS 107.79 TaxID=1447943 RepID=A0A6A5VQ79_9PLEO|nr:cytochrome P450 [Bimuria novae-zelandiae CBS 107.79]
MVSSVAWLVAVVSLAIAIRFRSFWSKSLGRLPPGPTGLSLLGNINDVPPPASRSIFIGLSIKTHGPISSVTVLGQTMVLVHDKTIALELLEKRSVIHSGRPSLKFGFYMVGWIDTLSSLPNNDTHRLYRKILYGYKLDSHAPDPLISLADLAMDQSSQATVPGRWLVDIFPILAHAPEWLPGANFKKTARLWKKTLMSCVNTPYNFAKENKYDDSAAMSFVSRAISQAKIDNGSSWLTDEQEHAIKWSAVSLYTGGEDTSAITSDAFFLSMSIFPEVQRMAQEELDRVVGTRRLPTFGDREQLPYINALVMEALRWHPIAPMGLPHTSDSEDTIDGQRIPKGSLILPNPERYLEPYNEPLPTDVVFKFGRRICPGRALADSPLFLTFAQALAVFVIRPAAKNSGEEIINVHTIRPGLVAALDPFEVTIRPRSEAHAAMIEQLSGKYPAAESDAKYIQGMMS